jgi:two-component system, LytTR family, response regulator
MAIRAIIIDDEEPARAILLRYLEDFPEVEVAGQYSNGFDGLRAIQEIRPELVFLDVQMPKLSGFELLELLPDPPAVIFTTAYDQYAVKAFERNAIDYLLKPFSRERFALAVERAFTQRQTGDVAPRPPAAEIPPAETLDRVVVKTGSKIRILPVDEIRYLEAQDDYVMLYLENEKHLKEKTMRYFEEHLPSGQFIRIHRSYIVNVAAIDQIELYDRENYLLKTREGRKLPVSRAGYQRLREALKF